MLLPLVPLPPVAYIKTSIEGVPVQELRVNLKDPAVRVGVVLAQGFPGGDEEFGSMVKRADPVAAVNGAYFSKETKKPIGDIVINGNLVNTGLMGTALALTSDGRPDILRVVRSRHMDWTRYSTVLACGPALMLDGKVDVNSQDEGFRDPHVTGSTRRMAIGYTKDRQLVIAFIDKPVTFEQEAEVMAGLGCYEAMNLDGGASLALFADGKTRLAPGRRLTNIVAVWLGK